MSFHVDFKAKNAADAKKIIGEQYLPPVVKAFIETALQNASIEEQAGPWHIRASGHLVETPLASSGSQSPSSAELKVEPIYFTKSFADFKAERLEADLAAERKRNRPAGSGLLSQDAKAAVSISAGERR